MWFSKVPCLVQVAMRCPILPPWGLKKSTLWVMCFWVKSTFSESAVMWSHSLHTLAKKSGTLCIVLTLVAIGMHTWMLLYKTLSAGLWRRSIFLLFLNNVKKLNLYISYELQLTARGPYTWMVTSMLICVTIAFYFSAIECPNRHFKSSTLHRS